MIFYYELIFIAVSLHYFYFLFEVMKGLKKIKKQKLNSESAPKFLSVIIPFRNEEKHLAHSLQSLGAQNYPKEMYELIYVDDASDDESVNIIKEHDYNRDVKLIQLHQEGLLTGFKKAAIEKSIQVAHGEIIVTTDADCIHPKNWLQLISNNFDEQTGFLSMPVAFHDEKSFFKKIQKLEFAGLVLAGAGLIGNGTPAICNGANIAFRNSLFKKVGGYEDNKNLSSGDDEFLMQKIFKDTGARVKFLFHSDALVLTHGNNTLKQFYAQRKRWASKGFFYKNKFFVFRLGLIFLFFLALSAGLFVINRSSLLLIIAAIFFSKILLEYLILREGKDLLGTKLKLTHIIFAEIAHPFYIVAMSIAGTLGGYVWKDRKVKR